MFSNLLKPCQPRCFKLTMMPFITFMRTKGLPKIGPMRTYCRRRTTMISWVTARASTRPQELMGVLPNTDSAWFVRNGSLLYRNSPG